MFYNSTGEKLRQLVFIGDSYQVGSYKEQTFTSFVQLFIERYSSEFGPIYHNEMGFYGFIADGTKKFLTLLQQLDSQIANKKKITDIVVTGGYNDYKNVSGIGPAIQEFMAYVKTTYPNAQVWLAPVAVLHTTYAEDAYKAMDAWKFQGNKYGANVINGIETCLRWGGAIISDHVHPNQNGQNIICQALYNGLKTGSYHHQVRNASAGFTADSAFNSMNYTVYSDQHGNLCTLLGSNVQWFYFKTNKKIVADGKTPICLGSIPNACTYGPNFAAQFALGDAINVVFRIGAENKFKNVNCILYVYKGKLYICPFDVEDAGLFKEFNSGALVMPPFRMTVDNTRG